MFLLMRTAILVCLTAAAISGQQPGPGFDVASVKPAATTDGRALLQATPGRLQMTNLTLRRMILIAYDLQDYQLAGAPAWIESEQYDVEAKADGTPSVQQMQGPMLR